MKQSQIKLGGKYHCRVSGNMVVVQIIGRNILGGYNAVNLKTGRNVFISSARRLQGVAQ